MLLGGPAHLIMNASVLLFCAVGSPGASHAGSDAEGAGKGRSRDNDPLDELQQDEVCHPLAACTFHMYYLPNSPADTDRHSHFANAAACMTMHVMQGATTHCEPQLEELEHRLKEEAVDLNQRIRQELAFPAVVHFYSWLLQGVTPSLMAHYT